MSRERLCDYFAVVGPRDGDLENRIVPETYSIQTLHRSLEEAIVDICVVNHPKETIPFDDNYELLLKPDRGDEEDRTKLHKHFYLCLRRRKHNRVNNYITEVRVIRKGTDAVPEGFELIEKTIGGASADLNRGLQQTQIFLAIKRAAVEEESFRFSTPPTLLDLCLVADPKGSAAPLDYTVLPRTLPKLGTSGEDIYLAYRHGPRAGLCDVPFDASTLEWFPDENTYEDFPLPQNELPMFCFPRGLFLKHEKRDNAPMPSYFSFVFTSIDGDRVHVACLQFWELLPDKILRSLEAKQQILTVVGSFSPGVGARGASGAHEWDRDEESSVEDEEDDGTVEISSDLDSDEGEGGAAKVEKKKRHRKRSGERTTEASSYSEDTGYGLYAPKCLCIITHWPFYRGLRSFLQQIYRISLSPAAVPIERYISYFTHYVPLPPPGVHALHLHLDLGLHDPVENSSLTPITLRLPDARSLPLMDLDYDAPFRALSLDNVVKIFLLLLLEERLLFLSSSTSLLTETTETILTLLFPLEWLSCYIPRLPNKLHEVLDAPGSLVIGIHLEGSTSTWTSPELSDPIWVVDLDNNRVIDASPQKGTEYAAITEELPLVDGLKAKLKAELEKTSTTVLNAEGLRERDSAFELPAIPGMGETDESTAPKLSADVIRDAFLVFMCDLLGGYIHFFNNQEGQSAQGDPNGVFGAFDVQAYLATFDPKTLRPFMEKLALTQMFAALVQKRTEHALSNDMDRLVFFETCVQELKERRAAEAALAKRGTTPVTNNDVKALPAPSQGSGAMGTNAGKPMPRSPAEIQDRQNTLLLHKAVMLMSERREEQQHNHHAQVSTTEALVADITSPVASPIASPRGAPVPPTAAGSLPHTIIIPGPGSAGCGPEGTSYSYTTFPTKLNKTWMVIPPAALPPVLVEIMSKRKKAMKKGNRMVLARSVNECMKDWQAIGRRMQSVSGRSNKEMYLAMQIFGIFFMSLPTRVTYKGRPLKIIMQAMGIMQFILDFQAEKYMDEAMWRSLLVACGRCGHSLTRKAAIAIFEIMRRSGSTINALTYGQYTKALAEKDAIDIHASPSDGRIEIDDSPWLEAKGRDWYIATCEPPPPETLKKAVSVAEGLKSFIARATTATAAGFTKIDPLKAREKHAPLAEDEHWTSELRDPRLSAYNTSISSVSLDSAGIIGMWVVCLCMNCEYMPLDEEIMTMRQDLLLVQAHDPDDPSHLLLCPKCENPLMPRLYYDIKTCRELATVRSYRTRNRSISHSDQSDAPAIFFAAVDSPTAPLRQHSELSLRESPLRGEISGCGLDSVAGDHVDYMSPFTLRTRLERLLLEHGEECLTREWCRTNQPDLYWNLVWFSTRLSVPFPLLLESLEVGEVTATFNEGSPVMPPRSRSSVFARRESQEKLQMFFHEIVVVGWEGLVVRARCERIEAALKARVLTPGVSLKGSRRGSSRMNDGSVSQSGSIGPLGGSGAGLGDQGGEGGENGTASILALLGGSQAAMPPITLPPQWVEALGPLPVDQLFPNVSAKELEVLSKVRDIVVAKGPAGLKEAMTKFLASRAALGGWTSEAMLGSMYRVFLKLAANYRVKKLHNAAPVHNLNANPGLEHEYTTAVMKVGDRVLRDQAGKSEKDILAELPRRDAIKFRSVFGHLY